MTDTERTFFLWGAFLLLVFLSACAVADLIDFGKPELLTVVEDGPPPSMVTQMLEEAKEITRRAAEVKPDDAQ